MEVKLDGEPRAHSPEGSGRARLGGAELKRLPGRSRADALVGVGAGGGRRGRAGRRARRERSRRRSPGGPVLVRSPGSALVGGADRRARREGAGDGRREEQRWCVRRAARCCFSRI
jgi:hypothetical protein